MLTANQTAAIRQLAGGTNGGAKRGAPHLGEVAEALSDAFGGPQALAKMLRDVVNDPKSPQWLKTRAYGIVVNTISGASKLAGRETTECELVSTADLERKAAEIMRHALGVTDAMPADLAAVVAAWPELPPTARAKIVAAAGQSRSPT